MYPLSRRSVPSRRSFANTTRRTAWLRSSARAQRPDGAATYNITRGAQDTPHYPVRALLCRHARTHSRSWDLRPITAAASADVRSLHTGHMPWRIVDGALLNACHGSSSSGAHSFGGALGSTRCRCASMAVKSQRASQRSMQHGHVPCNTQHETGVYRNLT